MQMSMFYGTKEFRNDNPIRLIELFAGYGSQALALKYLGIQFEHHRISEWAVKSIQAYKDMHFADDRFDYSKFSTVAEIKNWLSGRISSDYNTPMTEQQINRLSEGQTRTIYNNMQATHNLGSITQINARDLAVFDTDKFCYIMTYSFPCQDLSLAGQGKGMSKGGSTRSGLLWEVERLLEEMTERPQILLMENVPQVVGSTGIKDFAQWIARLEEFGYKNYWQVMNAKDYGIPQNRNRCFMVSILGDYYYSFPQKHGLKYRLKDFLDKKVDEKYYLSDKTIEMFIEHTAKQQAKGNGFKFEPNDGNCVGKCITTREGSRGYENFIIDSTAGVMLGTSEQFNAGFCEEMSNTLTTVQKDNLVVEPLVWDGFNQQVRADSEVCSTITRNVGADLKRNGQGIIEPTSQYRIRKLTERECFRLMGVKNEDYKSVAANQSTSSLYHLAGDSIVTTCLMAIFGALLGVDYQEKINELTEELKQ